MLGVSIYQIRWLIRDRRLRAVRLGHRTVRVKASDLQAFIKALDAAPYPRVAS